MVVGIETTTSPRPSIEQTSRVTTQPAGVTVAFVSREVDGKQAVENGSCVCPPFFDGEECEKKKCLNGGERVVLLNKPECKCPHTPFISGVHCEVVKCANEGKPLAHNGSVCACPSPWYAGRFCEQSVLETYAYLTVPLLTLLLLIICCGVCRMDLCPRARRNRERAAARANRARNRAARDGRGGTSATAPPAHLLAAEQQPQRGGTRVAVGPAPNAPPYVIRLDTIPTFNPDMIGGVAVDEGKLLEPPPPYEQALSAPLSVNPPRYTPQARETEGVNAQIEVGRERRTDS